MTDWYERQDELEPGMVFNSPYGLIRLDRRVPGDGTKWYVEEGYNGRWFAYDATLEPGDLTGEPLNSASADPLPRP